MSTIPVLGLIGGTGLTQLQGAEETLEIATPYGEPSGPIQVIQDEPVRLLFLPRHGSPHRFPPHRVNYRANMWALREAGAGQVLAVSAVGGITEKYAPGTLAVSDQLVDFTWGREHTYHDSPNVPLVHVDFTHPYGGPLRQALLQAARAASLNVIDGGCIAVFQGPRLESAGEIEMARRAGCNMAGMTSQPEAGLARELGIDYAGLAVVSNWGAGVHNELISEDDIADTLKEPMGRVRKLLAALMQNLGG
ncbi:MAG: S-methyl-5'-thioinosine phosphorylase [Xanthomonadales bacterium]|jgi:5'-deoxy-5'-methylthioadenosine phosphorylase|nr:S-methyl-5'-thioinosine phosphorylase [Xanthomonadales bacterium]